MKRKPAVAGQFYSSNPSALSKEVREYVVNGAQKERAIGIVSPHAGLMYSGPVAGAVYSSINFPNTFILIGPNHTGLGRPVSIMSSGHWQIPTGELEIDESLAKRIVRHCKIVEEDILAHSMEHSIEVQLPFLLYFASDVKIVPITIMVDSLETFKLVGETLADIVKNTEYTVTIVASSDMSHYESDSVARAKDKKAIDKILALDPEGLYNTVKKEGISMCGYGPATIMMYSVNKLGARDAKLIKYTTSGDVSGDYGYVVGYAGVIIK